MLARLMGTCCARQALSCKIRERPKCPASAQGSCRGLAHAPAATLPSESGAAVIVLISAQDSTQRAAARGGRTWGGDGVSVTETRGHLELLGWLLIWSWRKMGQPI